MKVDRACKTRGEIGIRNLRDGGNILFGSETQIRRCAYMAANSGMGTGLEKWKPCR